MQENVSRLIRQKHHSQHLSQVAVWILLSHQRFLLFSNKNSVLFFSKRLFIREPQVPLLTSESMKINSSSYVQFAGNNILVLQKHFAAAFKPKPLNCQFRSAKTSHFHKSFKGLPFKGLRQTHTCTIPEYISDWKRNIHLG